MPINHHQAEAEIWQHLDQLIEAVQAKDLDSLGRLYAADIVSFDVEPPLQHVGVEAKLKNWARAFQLFHDVTYEVRDLTIAVDREIAFAHCLARLSGTLQDRTVTRGMWVRATFCLRKIRGTWSIAHDQASVPFDVQTGQGVANLEP